MTLGTTPTGIPITECDICGCTHPVTRTHCPDCGRASLFGHGNCDKAPKENDRD